MARYDEIFAGGDARGRPAIHPYAKMTVGEVVEITDNIQYMQDYAYKYASGSGKKFATRKVNGVLYVKRLS